MLYAHESKLGQGPFHCSVPHANMRKTQKHSQPIWRSVQQTGKDRHRSKHIWLKIYVRMKCCVIIVRQQSLVCWMCDECSPTTSIRPSAWFETWRLDNGELIGTHQDWIPERVLSMGPPVTVTQHSLKNLGKTMGLTLCTFNLAIPVSVLLVDFL